MVHSAPILRELTDRDIAVLLAVYQYNGCAIEHVHALFWPPRSSRSSCYRRLARLIAADYLQATRLPSTTGVGSGKLFLSLGGRGRAVVAEGLDLSLSSLPPRRPVTPTFLAHHFAVCDFRVALERAVRASTGLALVGWEAEAELKRVPLCVTDHYVIAGRSARRRIVLIADGAFTLAYHGVHQRALLEQDMGTMSPKRLALKLRGYLHYQEGLPAPLPVFFVVPSVARADQVASLALREAEALGADASVFFVATQSSIAPETLLTIPIWRQVGVTGRTAIVSSVSPGWLAQKERQE